MYKIAAFIEFDNKITKKILNQKKKNQKKIWRTNLFKSSSSFNFIYAQNTKNF